MIKVLLLSDLSREPARLLVKGISSFPNARGGWRFYQVPPAVRDNREHVSKIVSLLKDLQIDAIFGQWKGIDFNVAKQLHLPIVLYQRRQIAQELPYVQCDDDSVGKMAAEFFMRHKNMHLAFCGFKGMMWSDERFESFKRHTGISNIPEFIADDDTAQWEELSKWVSALPKPAGVFCCNDVNAKMLIETCLSIGLKIPEDVAVLGVDNDSFVCNITSPSITTIKLDFEKIGYTVGNYFNAAMESGVWSNEPIIHKPVTIVERESTPVTPVNDEYVDRIVSFMKSHFREGIRIKDAIKDIPLTRRAIEQRFKKEYGDKTMLKMLTELRIEYMKKLLLETDLPVFNAAIMSGFDANDNVNRIFRSYVGYSPTKYRETHR